MKLKQIKNSEPENNVIIKDPACNSYYSDPMLWFIVVQHDWLVVKRLTLDRIVPYPSATMLSFYVNACAFVPSLLSPRSP